MSQQERNEAGKFAAKSNEMRQVRSIRLTDTTWDKLGGLANHRGITRADLVETWMEGEYFELLNKVQKMELELQTFKTNSIQLSKDTLENLNNTANQRCITRKELVLNLLNNEISRSKLIDSNHVTQLDLLSDSESAVSDDIQPLNNTALAQRLKVDASNLAKWRMKGDEKFSSYTASKDPDGLAWRYHTDEKLYYLT